jgi:hypothetical protein
MFLPGRREVRPVRAYRDAMRIETQEHKVQTMLKRTGVQLVLWLLLSLFVAGTAMAQSTSAGLAGTITDASGNGVAGATVEVTHVPSGTTRSLVTDADGRFSSRGFRVGGPYTVTASATGFDAGSKSDVNLLLDQVTSVSLALNPTTATNLEAVEVVATTSDQVFSADNMGARTNITREQIESFPSIKRSIEDYVRFDPRVVQLDKERGGITGGGQNNRYNNIRIDGVPTNDQFGLNDSGLPALNQPISIDWIEEFNVGISNYDVTQKDFVGVNINAVTKSGGNEFHGSLYGTYRDSDMVGDDENDNEFKGFDDEWTGGGYVSGPIIEDVLYFFVGYERFERSSPGASTCVTGGDCVNQVNVSQAELDQIRQIASGYGLTDIGGQSRTADNTDDKYFLKLDWNINDDHRATFRYNKTEGSILRLNTQLTTLQLDSNYFEDNISFESYALMLYSNWSDSFATEMNVSYAEYRSLPTIFSRLPTITVNVRPGASVLFGTERSRHANELGVDTFTGYFAGDWFLGDHTIRVGFDYEDNEVYNIFLQDVFGNYTFANIEQFAAGNWTSYSLQRPANGDLDSVAAQFSYNTPGVFLQDTWTVNNNLTVSFGARADFTNVEDTPRYNAAGAAAFGYDNSDLPDGDVTVQPRIGFNYTFDSELRTQLRGGVGLFQGSAPGVWLSNSFSNPGGLAIAYSAQNGSGVNFDPDDPFVPATTNAAQLLNVMDPQFDQPTVWKWNIAFERELPWYGLIAGAEAVWSDTRKGVRFTHLNLGAPVTTLPDGRNSYYANLDPANFLQNRTPGNRQNRNRNFTDVLLLSNTEKGHAETYTLSLEKPFDNDWMAKIGYSYTRADEVSPGTSSVALSNWNNTAQFNPNDEEVSTSNYEIRDRFTGLVSKKWHFWGDNATSISLFYEGRTGRPYSYVFSGDANGDGRQFNDLFFIPTVDGAQFSSNSTQADIDAFLDYLQSDDYLNSHQGQVAERNANTTNWVHQFDLRMSQEIPLFFDTKGEVYLDILNIGNLINKDWGHIDEVAFPYTLGVARMGGIQNGAYVYDVSNFVNEGSGAITTPGTIRKDVAGESRWAVQIGFRFEF